MSALIFDLFGTLIDLRSDEVAHEELSKYLSRIHNNVFDFKEHLKFYQEYVDKGLSSAEAVWEALKKLSRQYNFNVKLTIKDIMRLHIEYHAKYLILFSDSIKALELARDNVSRLGLVSDADAQVANTILERLGIRKYFSAIVTSDEVGVKKPNPRLFLKAAEILSVRPSKCVVIGDSWKDVIGGKNAGMKVILLLRLGRSEGIFDYRPDYEAKNLIEAVNKALEILKE